MSMQVIIKYIVAFLLLIPICYYIFLEQYSTNLRDVSIMSLFVLTMVLTVLYCVSGLKYAYLVRHYCLTTFHTPDILLFPIAANFWGYIFPFKGGFFYATFFLKSKYHLALAETVSITLFIYMTMVSLTGISGLYFVCTRGLFFSFLTITSLFFMLNPLILYGLNSLLTIDFLFKWYWFRWVHNELSSVFSHTQNIWKDFKHTSTIMMLDFLHTGVFILCLYWAQGTLRFSTPFISIIMLTFMMKISGIFRLTPGNIGVEQLVAGGTFHVFGGEASQGIAISLLMRMTHILFTLSVGGLVNIYYMKYFELGFRQIWRSFKEQKTIL
ncbi:MAG: hypothetical protein GY801_31335 [bacterium]|nr:hypothetical protein [bacterium]